MKKALACLLFILPFQLIGQDAAFAVGINAYTGGDYQIAIDAFTKAIQHNPENINAYYNRAMAHEAIADFSGALANYNFILEQESANQAILLNRGIVQLQLADYTAAIVDFDAYTKFNQQDAQGYYYLGLAYARNHEIEKAFKAQLRAAEVNAKFDKPFKQLAILRIELKDYKRAIKDINRYLKFQPNEIEAIVLRAKIKSKFGEHKSALLDFTTAIIQDSLNWSLYFLRGNEYVSVNNLNAALVDFSYAIQLKTNNEQIYFNRGRVYYKIGNYKSAIDDLKKVILINADNELADKFLRNSKLSLFISTNWVYLIIVSIAFAAFLFFFRRVVRPRKRIV